MLNGSLAVQEETGFSFNNMAPASPIGPKISPAISQIQEGLLLACASEALKIPQGIQTKMIASR